MWVHFISGQFGLTGIELIVAPPLRDQIVMVAPLNDLALFQHHDGLRVPDRGEPVGNHKHGSAGHQRVHAPLNEFLRSGVDGGGCLVQNQHRRVGAGGSGDVQQLPLALTEVSAVAGQPGLIAIGQVADEIGRASCRERV